MERHVGRIILVLVAAALVPACGGGGSSGGGGVRVPDFVIAGLGALGIDTSGGASTAGNGGSGGDITVNALTGTDIRIRTGNLSVNTSFTIPNLTVNLGANPRTISGATSVTPPGGATGLIPGDAAGNATGLRILAGQTLTVNPDGGAGGTATLTFLNGVLVEGTLLLATVAASNDSVDLDLTCANLVVAPGGSIVLAGVAGGAIVDGGDGGGLGVTCTGDIIIRGTVNTSGGPTAIATGDGGFGGTLSLFSLSGLYLAGTSVLNSSGGAATGAADFGGDGGSLDLTGTLVGVFGAGTINSAGGAGLDGGADGGAIEFSVGTVGPVILSGTLNASGGHATGTGPGGLGGAITIVSNGFNIRSSATLTSTGGNGSGGGNGGDGGAVEFNQTNLNGTGVLQPSMRVTGGMAVASDITVTGGSGGLGGAGGTVEFTLDLTGVNSGVNPLDIVGYDTFTLSGANGTTQGGNGGTMNVQNLFHLPPHGPERLGGILNEVAVITNGGAASAGLGGSAGSVGLASDITQVDQENDKRIVSNTAAFTMNGGTGSAGGGSGGTGVIFDHFEVRNTGDASANGGAGGSGTGGSGGTFLVASHHDAFNSGDLVANGGIGADGGDGGALGVVGGLDPTGLGPPIVGFDDKSSCTNSGSLTANGGNGTDAGGHGGSFNLFDHTRITNTGNATINGGNGGTGNGGSLGPTGLMSQGGVLILCDGSINDSGVYVLNGGNSTSAVGGAGQVVLISGASTRHSGNCTANGGSGVTGGNGGTILFESTLGNTSVNGTMSVVPGTGGATPTAGNVFIDGEDQPLTAGVGTF